MADAQLPLDDHVRAAPFDNDDGFQQLLSEHHALDQQIQHLTTRSYPTPHQHYEEIALKKRKLALKDRIEAIMRSRDAARLQARHR
jgi:uncharacterized protein YdcH (DUF465 family)